MGNPLQSYKAPPAIWDQTVLLDTRQKWMCPALIPASQTVLNLPTLEG